MREKGEKKVKGIQKNREKEVECVALIIGALCVLLGLSFIIIKNLDHAVIMRSLAVVFILFGLMHVVGYLLHIRVNDVDSFDFSFGMFNVVLGVLILVYNEEWYSHFSLIIGLMLLFKGISWLQTFIEYINLDKRKFYLEWIYTVVLVILGLIFIIVDFADPYIGTVYHGISLIIEGGIEVFSILRDWHLHITSTER